MNRIVKITISNCYDCPFFRKIEWYASHQFACQKLNIESDEIDDFDSDERANLEIKDWFANKCELEIKS